MKDITSYRTEGSKNQELFISHEYQVFLDLLIHSAEENFVSFPFSALWCNFCQMKNDNLSISRKRGNSFIYFSYNKNVLTVLKDLWFVII